MARWERNGKWRVEVYTPIRRSATVATEAQAIRLEIKWQDQATMHLTKSPGRMTMETYLRQWLEEHDGAPATIHGYRSIVENHLIPEIGKVRLAVFSSLHWKAYRAKKAKAGNLPAGAYNEKMKAAEKAAKKAHKPFPAWTPRDTELTATSLRQHFMVLHKALNDACIAGLLPIHPLDGVKAPKPEKRSVSYFTRDQLLRVIAASEGTFLHLPILLAGGLGLRRGEVLGLTWADVDAETATLTVEHSLDYRKNRARLKSTKSNEPRRQRLTPGMVAALEAHRKEQAALRLRHADIWVDNDLVCCLDDGRPIHPDQVTKRFRQLVRSLGLPPVSFHGLRHTYLTLMAADGTPMRDLSSHVGHSSLAMMKRYAHVLDNAEDGIAARAERVLGV